MAKLYKTNGEVVEITPANGKKFTLEEAQKYVNGYVELVGLKHREQLICNEEAICLDMPYNKKATEVLEDKVAILGFIGFVATGFITEDEWAKSQQTIVDRFDLTVIETNFDGRGKVARNTPYFNWG